jgi:hypothetical protein
MQMRQFFCLTGHRGHVFSKAGCRSTVAALFLFLSGIFALPLPAATQARIELANGDRISGVLWQITDRTLLVDAVYGAYRIPLAMVKNIFIEGATAPARIYLNNDTRYVGTPVGGDGNGFRIRVENQEKMLLWQEVTRMEFDLPLEIPAENMAHPKP